VTNFTLYLITLHLFHLTTVRCRPGFSYIWSGFKFCNKQLSVKVVI